MMSGRHTKRTQNQPNRTMSTQNEQPKTETPNPSAQESVQAAQESVLPAALPTLPEMSAQESAYTGPTAKVYDALTHSWVDGPASEALSIEDIIEPLDQFENDPMGLGPDWDRGRGREMHARWANANPKWHQTELQHRYAPVRPDALPPELRNRFKVGEVPGIPGQVILNGDAVLMEVPRQIKEAVDNYRMEKKRRELFELNHGSADRLQTVANNTAGRGAAVVEGGLTQSIGALEEEAQAAAEAEEELYSAYGSTRSTFGGLQGNPQYNKFQPTGPKPNWGYVPPTR